MDRTRSRVVLQAGDESPSRNIEEVNEQPGSEIVLLAREGHIQTNFIILI